MIQDLVRQQTKQLEGFMSSRFTDPGQAVDFLSGVADSVLVMIIYYLSEKDHRWPEGQIIDAYGNLHNFINNMKEQENRFSATSVKAKVDETLVTWYMQVDAGVPNGQRVQLTLEQQQKVQAEEQLQRWLTREAQEMTSPEINSGAQLAVSVAVLAQLAKQNSQV